MARPSIALALLVATMLALADGLHLVKHAEPQRALLTKRNRACAKNSLIPQFTDYILCDVDYDSNLGGQGPQKNMPEELRYKQVYPGIDLVVTTIGKYSPNNPSINGLTGMGTKSCFGVFNVKSKTTVNVQFNFYAAGTTNPVTIERFYFSWFDVDTSKTATESVSFIGASEIYTVTDTELTSTTITNGRTFTASTFGTGADNPMDPMNLTPLQLKRTAAAMYVNASQWTAQVTVDGGNGGRNFVFAGNSAVIPHPYGCEDIDSYGVCQIIEDPHIKVFDGVHISLLSDRKSKEAHYGSSKASAVDEIGDMWVIKSAKVSMQARYLPDDDSDMAHLFVRKYAVGGEFLQNNTLLIGPLSEGIQWNGRSILNDQESIFNVKGLVNARRHSDSHLVDNRNVSNAGVDIEFPLGIKLTVNRMPRHVNIEITMPPLEGGQDGICGNFNGVGVDDTVDLIRQRDIKVSAEESLFPPV